jgi:hypothetical protein
MSAAADSARPLPGTKVARLAQLMAVVGFELRKAVSGRRLFAPLFLAGLPVLALAVRAALPISRAVNGPALDALFAGIFQAYTLRLGVFFATVAIFLQLVRREHQEQTLHLYLLVPVRRDLIVLGKYLAGLAEVGILFAASTGASYVLLFLPGGTGLLGDQFPGGPGLERMTGYMVIVGLATAVYGAVFLLIGALSRNPMGPVLAVFAFESVDRFLPAPIERLSVIRALAAWVAENAGIESGTGAGLDFILGPALLVPACLALAVVVLRRAEVDYTTG